MCAPFSSSIHPGGGCADGVFPGLSWELCRGRGHKGTVMSGLDCSGCVSGGGIAGQSSSVCNFSQTSTLFSLVTEPLCITTCPAQTFQFLYLLKDKHWSFCLFARSRPSGHKLTHSGFHLYLSNDWWFQHLFTCWLSVCTFSLMLFLFSPMPFI